MKPISIEPGDTIAVIAPASVPRDMAKFREGVEQLRSRGYNVELGREQYRRRGYLCGTDDERLSELNTFLRRPDIKLIIAARGGYGVLRILDHVDYAAARRFPKLVVGYSDVTALHFALYKHAGLPGLSGPMVAVEWHDPDEESERMFWDLARGGTPESIIGPRGEALRPVRPGTAEGVLLGGNLAMVVRLIGTPYLPPLDGALLFLEDVGEQPYRIDAMLAQLKLSGILNRLGGLIFGAFTDWQPEDGAPTLSLDEVIDDYARDLELPVAKGLVYGHFPVKNTLPVGVRARLEVTSDRASLGVLEPVVTRQ